MPTLPSAWDSWGEPESLENSAKAPRQQPPGHAATTRDRRASVRYVEGSHGSDALPREKASKSRRRDGPLGSRQSNPGREYRRDQTTDRCDRGLRPNRSGPLTDFPARAVFPRPRRSGHSTVRVRDAFRVANSFPYVGPACLLCCWSARP